MQKSFLILNYYILIYSIYCSINSQNSQQSIIQPLNISSRGCLTARQRSIALTNRDSPYQCDRDFLSPHRVSLPFITSGFFTCHHIGLLKQDNQPPIIQQHNVLSRGYLTARQRSNTLIYKALRYQIQTDRMDNNVQKAEDSDGIGGDGMGGDGMGGDEIGWIG